MVFYLAEVCFYFQVHQPVRLKHFDVFSDSRDSSSYDAYVDKRLNEKVFKKVARKCYLPANKLLLDLIHKTDGAFKISFSLTGILLEQAMEFEPSVVDSFGDLFKTGCVDVLGETYYHSLSSLYFDKSEFFEQVRMHSKAIEKFGIKPKVFRNTEALFSNDISKLVSELGYGALVGEGFENLLGWRSPNYVYSIKGSGVKALLRNYRLSDDVSYRFSARWWPEWPLTSEKFAKWLSSQEGDCVNLFMDYETFGEHQWADTGIFDFMKHLPGEVLKYENLGFSTAREVVQRAPVGEIDAPHPVSWADLERDSSAWLGNEMQRRCFDELQELGVFIRPEDVENKRVWRLLQSSDHFYYMCTKSLADGDVHKYFSHYESPYDSFINYANILKDFKRRLESPARGELDVKAV